MDEGDPEYDLRRHQDRAHILGALLKATDQSECEVTTAQIAELESRLAR